MISKVIQLFAKKSQCVECGIKFRGDKPFCSDACFDKTMEALRIECIKCGHNEWLNSPDTVKMSKGNHRCYACRKKLYVEALQKGAREWEKVILESANEDFDEIPF